MRNLTEILAEESGPGYWLFYPIQKQSFLAELLNYGNQAIFSAECLEDLALLTSRLPRPRTLREH
ncbi:MAG: hypothetical protein WBP94_18240 [Rhodomicrobiaceae bacterium]